ncbi:MAG: twin-arginine translocase subunit TatC [Verrucomicrobiota bacterium]
MAEEPLELLPDNEEDEGGPVKTFLEHLEDLRWVLIKCAAALGIGMAACLAAAPQITSVLTWPLQKAGINVKPNPMGPLGGFVISMKMAFYGGITLSLPIILYVIGSFIIPALKKNEKKYFVRAFIIGAGLFLAGVLLCYAVILPISLKGLVQYNEWMGLPTDIWRAEEYFGFVILFMIGMGLSFEIPVVILTLVRIGIIPHEFLIKGRAYFFIANLVLCAFITPDAVSTIFMVIPVQVLMEICILISKNWERQKRLAEAAAAASGNQVEGSAS